MHKLINAGAVNSVASGSKNKIINGDMAIDQRNAGAVQSALSTGGVYLVDRWVYVGSQTGKFNSQQNAGSITTPTGFINYLGLTVASAYTVGAGDYFRLGQRIEGINCRDLGWGTSNAQPVAIQFKVYSSLTGIFNGYITNSDYSRSCLFPFSISVANTWTTISVTIPGDTSGTWLTNTSGGIKVAFNLGVGATYTSATSGSWTAGSYYGLTGSVSVVATAGATFYVTGVQLEVGKVATSFEYLHYGLQLALCQRYYCKTFPIGTAPAVSTGVAAGSLYGVAFSSGAGAMNVTWKYPMPMRATPTTTYYNPISTGSVWNNGIGVSLAYAGDQQVSLYNSSAGTAGAGGIVHVTADAEL